MFFTIKNSNAQKIIAATLKNNGLRKSNNLSFLIVIELQISDGNICEHTIRNFLAKDCQRLQ